jgi:hypothetical protein
MTEEQELNKENQPMVATKNRWEWGKEIAEYPTTFTPQEIEGYLVAFNDNSNHFYIPLEKVWMEITPDADGHWVDYMLWGWFLGMSGPILKENARYFGFIRAYKGRVEFHNCFPKLDWAINYFISFRQVLFPQDVSKKPGWDAPLEDWFVYYHKRQAAGYRITLDDIAKEVHLTEGHIRNLHHVWVAGVDLENL